ncbi:hypothetical protein COJ85_29595 [Bacillus sp. AFS076308]|uniref:DUF6270 domain-containing protein n=1 Tax=Bacillus sp. AFS076308 TaxID=2033512 RepID=UPI000BF3D382|nr:DUF6270 domain-containing protein [Bacillus sp. AFS076308]PFN80576.1 hypothetical protein COJ85_29595 [Bacillus sp. AFS076308]
MPSIKDFQVNEDNLTIFFTNKELLNDINISFRLRDNRRWLLVERHKEYLVKPRFENNQYLFNINLTEILQNFGEVSGEKSVIDIYIKQGNDYLELNINDSLLQKLKEKKINKGSRLIDIAFFQTKHKTLGIKLSQIKIEPQLQSFSLSEEENKIQLELKTIYKNKEFLLNDVKILLKKRKFANISLYYEIKDHDQYFELPMVEDKFYITKDLFDHFILEGKTLIDIVVRYVDHHVTVELPLKIKDKDFPDVNYGKVQKEHPIKFYKTRINTLAILIKEAVSAFQINEINIKDHILTFDIDLSNITSISDTDTVRLDLCSTKKSSSGNDLQTFYKVDFTEIPSNGILSVKLNLEEIFGTIISLQTKYYSLLLMINGKKYPLRITPSLDKTEIKLSKCHCVCYTNETEVNFEIFSQQCNPIKLAVLGSCFTRAAFDSQNADRYFNPDYKRYFKVDYTYFWSSVISIVSQPIPFSEEDFSDLSNRELEDVRREYQKTTFKQLTEKKTDYILLDFFEDALHGVLKVDDNRFIGRNPTIRKSIHYKNNLLFNSENLDSGVAEFFDLWVDSCNKFIEKLTKIYPQERIILNTSKLTDQYYDPTHTIRSFYDDNVISKARFNYFNSVWTKMDNYFISKLPNALILDLEDYGFIGSHDHPINCGPHHYERGYYKALQNELLKVITFRERFNSSL